MSLTLEGGCLLTPTPSTPCNTSEQADFSLISTRAETLAAIATGIDLDSLNDDGLAPLHLARNEEVARALVDADADVDIRVQSDTDECDFIDHDSDEDSEYGDLVFGVTPLHLARDAGVARVLIRAGADVGARDWGRLTPLHRARSAGVVRALIEAEACTEDEDPEGKTPLEYTNDVEVARALLDGGADVNHWREDTWDTTHGSPLINSTDNEDIALLLIERGADVNASYKDSSTEVSAVWRHVRSNNFRVVREMLRKKAVVDSGDVVEAARDPSDEMLRILIGSVGVSVTNKHGETALHSARNHVKLLLDLGADVHARDNAGNTPLHTHPFGEAAVLFIERGADIEAVNKKGETPLHVLCESISRPCSRRDITKDKFKVLVRAGASFTAEREDGKTPFNILRSDLDLLKLLCLE